MSQTCNNCTLQINSKSSGIQCTFCSHFFHIKCVNISKNQLDVLSTVNGCLWKCTGCSNTAIQNNDKLFKVIETLQVTVNQLQEEIKNMKRASDNICNSEIIISEITERQKREKNIIIYNLNEALNGTVAEKKAADVSNVKDLLNKITPESNFDSIKVFRVGKSHNNKPAPVKVILASRNDVLNILKNKKILKETNDKRTISTDQTKMQQEYLKKVKTELNNRKQNGEENIYIKYVNGIPTIAQSKNSL